MAIHEKYADTVNKAARWAAGIGVPGSIFPPLDMAGMSIVWVKMTREIAKIAGHKVNWFFAVKLIYSITAGSLLYIGGSKLINALLHAIPGAGTVTAAGANAIFNYVYTKRLGNMLVSQFDQPELNQASLLSMAKTIALAVFVDVTADEVADAYADIGDQIEVDAYEGGDSSMEQVTDEYVPQAASPEISPESHQSFNGSTSFDANIRFGGLENTQTIAGLQVGPECGIHAVGNLVQLDNPGIDESINDLIRQVEYADGGLDLVEGGYALGMDHYEHILETGFNVPVHWEYFDHGRIANFLNNDHAILVVGDAHYLDPATYPDPEAWHAFNLTDIWVDQNGQHFYAGLDSNMPGKVMLWPFESVHNAVANSPYPHNALITDRPVRWPYKT